MLSPSSFARPLCLYLYGEFAYGIRTKIPWVSLMIALVLCVLPCGCGIALRQRNTEGGCRGMLYWEWVEKVGGVTGALFLALAVGYGCATNEELFTDTSWKIWVICSSLQLSGYFGESYDVRKHANAYEGCVALIYSSYNFRLT